MMVLFTSRSEKKAIPIVRRILDCFADRIGNDTWQTVITHEGLQAVNRLLRRTATKSTAVSCRWIRSRSRSQLLWIVGNRQRFDSEGRVPVNWTAKNILHNERENARIIFRLNCGNIALVPIHSGTNGFRVSFWKPSCTLARRKTMMQNG